MHNLLSVVATMGIGLASQLILVGHVIALNFESTEELDYFIEDQVPGDFNILTGTVQTTLQEQPLIPIVDTEQDLGFGLLYKTVHTNATAVRMQNDCSSLFLRYLTASKDFVVAIK